MNPIYRNITSFDWITIVLFLSLVLLVVSKYFYKNSFASFIILPFSNKYITTNRKKGKMVNGFHLLMTFFQTINLALLIYVARNLILDQEISTYPEFFGVIAISILAFYLMKTILQIANGYFFENYWLMTDLIFEKLSYFNYGGLIAFAGNIFLIYIFQGFNPFVYAIISLIIVVNGIGLVNILRNRQKLIVGNTFYFILYLCTLEIAPIVIIISYLNS